MLLKIRTVIRPNGIFFLFLLQDESINRAKQARDRKTPSPYEPSGLVEPIKQAEEKLEEASALYWIK